MTTSEPSGPTGLFTGDKHAHFEALRDRLQRMSDARIDSPEPRPPRLTEADLCDYYSAIHPPTVFAAGRYWRLPRPDRAWQPLSHNQVAAELLDLLQQHQDYGVAPTRQRLASLEALLRHHLDTVAPGRWDNAGEFLVFPTELRDRATGLMHPYPPEHALATTFPYDHDAAATAPAWQAFLASTVPDAAEFLQEFFGYCLTTDVHLERSLWLCGGPNSGKSTVLHALRTLLGPFAGELSLPDLARRRLDPATFTGKFLLISDEAPADLAAARHLSALIAGEPFHLAGPHGLATVARSRAKLVVSLNALPVLDDRFNSLYRRAALVYFPDRPDGAEDHRLKDRLGREGPGLLQWAFRGLDRLYTRGRFDPPSTVLAAAQRLRLAHNAPAAFVAECCQVDPQARTQAAVLHQAFLAWCQQLGLPPLSARALAVSWQALGFERLRLRDGSFWCGVNLLVSPGQSAAAVSQFPSTAQLPGPADPPVHF